MGRRAGIDILDDGGLDLVLDGTVAAHVPAAQADRVHRLIAAADGERAQRLVVTGIVAGIALGAAPSHSEGTRKEGRGLS